MDHQESHQVTHFVTMAAGGLSAEHMMSKQLPAPKTFAPSREDILSNLAFFFGDPAVPEVRAAHLTRRSTRR